MDSEVEAGHPIQLQLVAVQAETQPLKQQSATNAVEQSQDAISTARELNGVIPPPTGERPRKSSVIREKLYGGGCCCSPAIALLDEIRGQCVNVNCQRVVRRTFSMRTLKRFLPIVGWLPKYRLEYLQGDIIAGITVGLTVIPQSLAYAKIAELPPQYGLYTAFMACFVYCIFGTSKDASIGPAAIMSLLTAEFGHSVLEGDATYAVALSLVCGVVQIAMGFLHIGFLVEYISHPVINSFTTAAAITIVSSQIKKWLGLHGIPRGFVQQVYALVGKLPETQLWDFGLGLVCMISLYGLKRFKNLKLSDNGEGTALRTGLNKVIFIVGTARNAIIVIVAASVAAVLYHQDHVPFTLTGNITSGIPAFRPPSFTITHDNQTHTAADMFQTMGLGVILVPLVGVIEVIAVGKAFGRRNGYKVDANQELLATGFSNLLGSFVSAYPVTASFSRSAVNSQSGSATTIAGVVTGALVLLALAVLTPLFFYIPDPALAAVIIMAVVEMVNFGAVKHLWQISKPDLLPWFTTFVVSLGAGFEYGILLGVAVSLLILLYPWARPPMTVETYGAINAKSTLNDESKNIIVVNVSMGLMFPGVEHLQEKIMDKAFKKGQPSKSVVLDFSRIHRMDYTSALGIQQLTEDFARRRTWLVFVNVAQSVLNTLARANVQVAHVDSTENAVKLMKSSCPSDDSVRNVIVRPKDNLLPLPMDPPPSPADFALRIA